ncbi:Fe(3+) ABC transporter substrate-binding protein [Haliea atlantica]
MGYRTLLRGLLGATLGLQLAFTAPSQAQNTEVNIYSARQEALIKPLLDRFTADTGIDVNLVTGDGDALLTRLRNEGRNSPADLLLTTDAGRLYRAQEAGVLQPLGAPELDALVPAHLRSSEDYWIGLSLRARVIVYAPDRVDPEELSTYQALAEPRWKGRVCIRSSSNIYNQSLVASFLANHGEEETMAWLEGLVGNFARPPQGGDRDQIKAVAVGQCDVAVVNSYYLGGMLRSSEPEERAAADAVALFWPNQAEGESGTHINISGAGLTRAAKNPDAARALIRFLLTAESQQWYAETNNEYPVRDGIPVSAVLSAWGEFRGDTLDVTELGQRNADAVMAMDRAGWK